MVIMLNGNGVHYSTDTASSERAAALQTNLRGSIFQDTKRRLFLQIQEVVKSGDVLLMGGKPPEIYDEVWVRFPYQGANNLPTVGNGRLFPEPLEPVQ